MSALKNRKSMSFLGINIDAVTYSEMFESIDRWLENKDSRSHHIACLNAYCVVLGMKDPRLARIYNGADIAGPDGMPFVRWIRAFGRVACDRFAAPDILLQLAERARKKDYSFYLYGGAPDVVKRMKAYLEERYPYIRIVGYSSPPFRALSEEEDEAICQEINRLKPDILCVGLGTPKQDFWIDEHLEKIHGSVFLASGATFDFFGGRIKMAPEFIRRSGFEWLYRLCSRDFSRLWYRYTVMNAVFLWNFFLQLTKLKRPVGERWSRYG